MTFERAQAIADSVLLEGYVLYPYRASSTKNQYRWTFGVVAPRAWSEADGSDPWWLEAQVLVEGDAARLRARVRFLHVVERRVEARTAGGAFAPAERLEVGERLFLPWEEGEIREVDLVVRAGGDTPFEVPARARVEIVRDATGAEVGRVVRAAEALSGVVRVRVEPAGGGLTRVAVRVENVTPHPPGAARPTAMRASFVSTHVMLAARGGARFVSLQDPPAHAREAAARCKSTGSFPVLAGDPEKDDLVLAAPIVLYDHPRIAPESPGDFFDACEIDEMLAFRTKTLTPDEKLAARAADPRTAALLDRVEALSDEALARLHGAVREKRAAPRFSPGARVRLRPGRSGRRTDAQDILFDGLVATVEALLEDVDGRAYVAVTIDDDPGADLHRYKGRFLHYYLDEIEALDAEGAS